MKKLNVGIMLPGSNVFTSLSKDFKSGFNLAIESFDCLDIKIYEEFVNQGHVNDVQRAAEKLIMYHNVDCLSGIVSSFVSLAIRDFIQNKRIPFLLNNLGENIFLKDAYPDCFFLNSAHLWKSQWALGKYVQEKHGGELSLCTTNYDSGYHFSEAFRQGTIAGGGETTHLNILKLQPGIYNTESLIERIYEQEPKHVYAALCGSDALDFWMRYKKSGLLSRTPLSVSPFFFETFSDMDISDVEANVLTASSWKDSNRQNENKKFTQSYFNEFNEMPSMFSILGYESGLLLAKAAKASSSKSDFFEQLKMVATQGPRGFISFDFLNNVNSAEIWLKNYHVKEGQIFKETYEQPIEGVEFQNDEIQKIALNGVSGWQNPYLCI